MATHCIHFITCLFPMVLWLYKHCRASKSVKGPSPVKVRYQNFRIDARALSIYIHYIWVLPDTVQKTRSQYLKQKLRYSFTKLGPFPLFCRYFAIFECRLLFRHCIIKCSFLKISKCLIHHFKAKNHSFQNMSLNVPK